MKSQHTENMLKYMAGFYTPASPEDLLKSIREHFRAWSLEDLIELLEEYEVVITHNNLVTLGTDKPLSVPEFIQELACRHTRIEVNKLVALNNLK